MGSSLGHAGPRVSLFVFHRDASLQYTPYQGFPKGVPWSNGLWPTQRMRRVSSSVLYANPSILPINGRASCSVKVRSSFFKVFRPASGEGYVKFAIVCVRAIRDKGRRATIKDRLRIHSVDLARRPFPVQEMAMALRHLNLPMVTRGSAVATCPRRVTINLRAESAPIVAGECGNVQGLLFARLVSSFFRGPMGAIACSNAGSSFGLHGNQCALVNFDLRPVGDHRSS